MKLSEEAKKTLEFGKQNGLDKIHLYPPSQTREMMKHAFDEQNKTKVENVIDENIGLDNIPVRIYVPQGREIFPVISYFHGGGFTLMSLDSHDEICRKICNSSKAIIMSVGYRLAPENPYPAGPLDCLNATKWMIENAHKYNGNAEKLALAGDSAGGYMAFWVAQRLSKQGIDLKAQFATYPVTDHYSANHNSWEENKDGYLLTAEMMKWFWDNFTTDSDQIEEASPLRSEDFSGQPPTMIFTCHFDPLRDEGKAYAIKLIESGVETHYKNFPNIHGFFGTNEMGMEAMEMACKFLHDKLYS
ncbi:alpha/beta hydrolase [Zunongwangia sp. HGR-M22]|uniref:alpha/beta hydrolase n=1 Tax=Zunongwangia sp. HGR-M22 TaxID=3015168 RepID=UPI0022DE11D8|nr:alpha/beta hydrolase [Zunongwangia sp. HGR-M22]WBL24301.1 alpha/beta hydrolase [Zunongwangia sp. HGR-M22]